MVPLDSKHLQQDAEAVSVHATISAQALKAAIWYGVAQIVEEEEVDLAHSASEAFVASLTELVYAQIETLALDLKAFAAHAGRNTIRADDVRLMARKTSALQDLINQEAQKYDAGASNSASHADPTTSTTGEPGALATNKVKPKRVGVSVAKNKKTIL